MGEINQNLDESSDSYQIFLADLRGKVHVALRAGRTYEQIADGLYVSPRTIQAFAEGKTRKPSSFTVERLAMALGFRLAIVPADMPRIPGEAGYE
ncbi:MAG: hypothetical protein RLZZ70_599 [Candidatus Parcubacteria bacterium]|jgi:transcriptional regulator with XRE-family HTH domain